MREREGDKRQGGGRRKKRQGDGGKMEETYQVVRTCVVYERVSEQERDRRRVDKGTREEILPELRHAIIFGKCSF